MNDFAKSLIVEGRWSPERLRTDYDARATVGDRFPEEMLAYRKASNDVSKAWLTHADIVYDAESGQTLDIYGTDPADPMRPLFIFIHGGYWRALSKADSAMMAGMLAKEGVATAVIDYELAPAATLSEIVRQVRAALAFLWQHGDRFGIDGDRIHIGGSSAGAHLVGMLLASGWHAAFGVPENIVKSALAISGLFELAPIAATFPQEWLSLDAKAVADLSPIRHLPRLGCPLSVTWAEKDAAGFKRQSTAFVAMWSGAGHPIQSLEVQGRNHFDILMDLGNAETELSQVLLSSVKGSGLLNTDD